MAETDMLHNILRYHEVSTELEFVYISNTLFEMRTSVKSDILNNRGTNINDNIGTKNANIEDEAEFGKPCNNTKKPQQLEEMFLQRVPRFS